MATIAKDPVARVTPPVSQYAPPKDREESATISVPQLTRDAMLKMFETAAARVEQAAEALMQMTIERVAEAKATAQQLRELGELQANSIERAANLAKDCATRFTDQRATVEAFRKEGA